MLGRDAIAGLAILAASLILFALTSGLEENPLVPIGPAVYPRFVLGITAGFAALLVAAELLARRRAGVSAGPKPEATRPNYPLVVLNFALFALYVGALPYIGFRIATFVYIAATQVSLEAPRTPKRWIVALVVAFATTAVSYVVFEHYLSVLLPRGRWTEF